jgi:hypothetical protein
MPWIPISKLGGPVLSSDQEAQVWSDASGNTCWLNASSIT